MPPLFILLRKRTEFLSVPSYAETAETSHGHRVRASEKESIGDQQGKIWKENRRHCFHVKELSVLFSSSPYKDQLTQEKKKNKPSGAKLDPMKNAANKTTIKTPGMYCARCAVMIFHGNNVWGSGSANTGPTLVVQGSWRLCAKHVCARTKFSNLWFHMIFTSAAVVLNCKGRNEHSCP